MDTKICTVCKKEKSINDYYPNYSSSGYKTFCRQCQNFKRRYNLKRSMISNAKRRAKAKGYAFDIDLPFIENLAIEQNNKCALTGWLLDWDHTSAGKRICPPNRASIDRVDSNLGYTKNNVQLLADMVNRVKSNYTQDLFLKMCVDVTTTNKTTENS